MNYDGTVICFIPVHGPPKPLPLSPVFMSNHASLCPDACSLRIRSSLIMNKSLPLRQAKFITNLAVPFISVIEHQSLLREDLSSKNLGWQYSLTSKKPREHTSHTHGKHMLGYSHRVRGSCRQNDRGRCWTVQVRCNQGG